ncbi:MAG: hypothetical protein GF329_12175 [Candidatus Lokiarchaeota archaeon]|nr:hypothetical protein [Candidatus Lokiarchaeota archaeon]
MAPNFEYIHLPLLHLVIIITFQMTIYLLYLYYRTHDKRLELNKFILALAFLYGFGLTGVFIRTLNSYYIRNPNNYVFYVNLTHILIVIAVIGYLSIISSKSFEKIFNLTIIRTILIIASIISILLLIVQSRFNRTLLVLISIFIGIPLLIYVRVKLINYSRAKVRKRLIITSIGEFITLTGILIQAEEFIYELSVLSQEYLKLIAVFIIIFGLLIVFLGIYRFPAFLELNWRNNLIALYVIDSDLKKIHYSYNFLNEDFNLSEVEQEKRDILFSKGLMGIEDVLVQIAGGRDKKINKIKQEDFVILIKYGDSTLSNILFCLLIEKEMDSSEYFLDLIRKRFREQYRTILNHLNEINGKEKLVFSSFDYTLQELIS